MARILVATTPVPGHVNPVATLTRRLVDRGNEVVWYTGAGFAPAVEATGARHAPITHRADWSLVNPHDQVPQLRDLTGLDQVRTAFRHLFIDAAPDTLADLERILETFDADVVVANGLVIADRWLAERGGPPSANIATTMYGLYSRDTAPFGPALMPKAGPAGRLRNAAMNAVHRKVLFRLGQPAPRRRPRAGRAAAPGAGGPRLVPLALPLPAGLHAVLRVPALGHPSAAALHRAAAARAAGRFTPPAWWPELQEGRPVVLVTQGTVRNEDDLLFAPAFEALAGEDVLVIATTGGGSPRARAAAGATSGSSRTCRSPTLMPHVSAYITNGGYGGVQLALSHGVPIVVSGATEDKPEVAARVAWSGAGVRVREARPSAASIRAGGARGAATTRPIGPRPGGSPPTSRRATPRSTGSRLIEQLAATGEPVLSLTPEESVSSERA